MAQTQQDAPDIQQSDAQSALSDFITKLVKEEERTRYAEEREWATAGYFDQLKQWLEEDSQTSKLRPMTKKSGQKWPQPVTNLFSKAIGSNSNALGADVPRMSATSDNYDHRNRRAAEAAEQVIDAANRESGMDLLTPKLGRQTVLFGMGCTYDTIAFDRSTVEIPTFAEPVQAQPQPAAQPQVDGQDADNGAAGVPAEAQEDAEPAVSGVMTVPTARLQTELLTPFEYIIPRDAQDANLADWQVGRIRRPVGKVKELFPDYADKIKADDDKAELSFYYLNTLRSLSYQTQKSNEGQREMCTLTVFNTKWTALPEEVQKKITGEWENEPSEVYEEQQFTKAQAAVEYGITAVVWNGCIVQWSENWLDGDSPFTFFPFQKDAVCVYPKGLSVELIPLTKSLNRVDSLMMRAVMSHGTQKLLWPTSQTTPIPSGDPVEVVQYDPIGEGKVKPEYVSGTAYGRELIALREQIVADIKELSYSNSVAEGEMPGSGTAFRALAYLGSKAEETRKTMRFLWEQAHELRARKLLKMARKVWTEPRKVQTVGFNNRYGAMELDVADLDGGYQVNVVQDSSKPKTQTEKLQVLQLLQQGGYINPQDAATRDYVFDATGMQELDPADHLQELKAERDLEKLKMGIQPMQSPFEKWDVTLRVLANYTLTEEFEGLDELTRHGILMYAQFVSQMLSVSQGAPLGMPPPPPMLGAGDLSGGKAGPGGQTPGHVLGQVPGAQVSNSQVEGAAIREAAQVVPNAPSPTA